MKITSVLITGANRGIGLEFVRQFVALPTPPKHVIATCRNPDAAKELQKVAESHGVIILALDLSDTGSFDSLVDQVSKLVESDGLHLLINNAGVLHEQSLADVTEDALMESFKVNTVAPLLLIKKLRKLLTLASKADSPSMVVNISSIMGSIANAPDGPYPYKISKAALNMTSKCLSSDLREDGIVVCMLHPGWVQTEIGGVGAKISSQESVQGMMQVIVGMDSEKTGKFFRFSGNELPW